MQTPLLSALCSLSSETKKKRKRKIERKGFDLSFRPSLLSLSFSLSPPLSSTCINFLASTVLALDHFLVSALFVLRFSLEKILNFSAYLTCIFVNNSFVGFLRGTLFLRFSFRKEQIFLRLDQPKT
jgi:hypothetical protein